MVKSHLVLNLRNLKNIEAKVVKFIFNNMKKDKIFELRIDEDDEVSGIDSISLVDEPAIEVNWVAFNKEKEHEFHIPDGEDDKYFQMLLDKAESEDDLLAEGYVLHSVEYLTKDSFATNPNANSEWDEDEFKVRYKYMLNPSVRGQAAVIDTTRDFCKNLINKNYVWRVEEMEALTNDQGSSALVWRGGYNCRHLWGKMTYRKDATIINKASINKGKTTDGGFPSGLDPQLDVLGYPQPDTVTSTVVRAVAKGTAAPTTVRNLGLSKQKFEAIDIFGFKPRYFHMCPGAIELFKHLVSMQMNEETVGMVRSAAQVADNIFRIEEEVIKSELASPEQLMEAVILLEDFKDIMNEIDDEVGMDHDVSFMDGHIVKIKEYIKEDLAYDVSGIVGYVDPGVKKKKKKDGFQSYTDYPLAASENARRALKWAEKNGWGSCGTPVGKIRANQLASRQSISEETISRMASFERHRQWRNVPYDEGCGGLMWDAWGGTEGIEWAQRKLRSIENAKFKNQRFEIESEEKRIVVGPAMIPNLRIFRKDKQGNPYHVFFTEETIRMIAEKYMRFKYIDNNDTNHDGKANKDVYVIESWIKEDDQDKSSKYGYEELPIGTWFVSMKVKNDDVWKKIKEGKLRGYSVSGYFEEIAQFCREEMFLKQLADLLKNIKD